MQAKTGAAVAVAGIGVAAAALTAGCGGGGKTYSGSATAACLRSKGASVDRQKMDSVAKANHGYHVSGLEEGGVVNLSFGNPAKIKDAYPRFLIEVDSIGNAVLAWYTFRPAADREVRGCLR